MTDNITTNSENQEKESGYIINIDKFSGPLDVLWELIKKSKIDITEVSLSKITEQYIEFLKLMEEMDVKLASDFILLASELIYYKSRALIPTGEVDDEYFTQPLPPELIQKLLEYKKYQKVTDELKDMYETQNNVFIRHNVLDELGEEEYYLDVSLYELLKAFSNVLNSTNEVETGEIIFDEILVSDRIEYITELLKEKEAILFTEIFSAKPSKAEVIATFLAMLEMSKTKMVRVQQHRVFGEIRILRNFTLENI
ncbi:MAG TPA: segregation/condensation protein A [Spirochaetota bacterium]|nr:segregation/condensation protein A [Spirochaetota bacterium]HPF06502.1 segregation/condensation protein A [Spirochaetota bacterium]HPJ43416.1 segregation/condensation protein A [Spirochaetota bacterium]HPR37765.1 segregation/condensation protein A [Spirochaetota bacterium]HRX47920.1 segregation/condensation protein A [Spirochaetota bacterium]